MAFFGKRSGKGGPLSSQNAVALKNEAIEAAKRFNFSEAVKKGEEAYKIAKRVGLASVIEIIEENLPHWRNMAEMQEEETESHKRELGLPTKYKKSTSLLKEKVSGKVYHGFTSESELHDVLRDTIGIVKHFIREKNGEKLPSAEKITPKQVLYARGPSFLLNIALRLREKIDALHNIILGVDKKTIEENLYKQLERKLTEEEKEMGVKETDAMFLRKEVKMLLYDSKFVNFMENFEKKKLKILHDLDGIRDYWREIVKLRGEVPESGWWHKNRLEGYNDMSIVYPFSQEIHLMLKIFDLMHAQLLMELDPIKMITDLVDYSNKTQDIKEKIRYLRQAERIAKKAKMEERSKQIQKRIDKLQNQASNTIIKSGKIR